jgi:8-oxo-dGTP diphosphatase
MDKTSVSQKAVIVNADGKFLVLLRGKTAPSSPLKWDLPGGDLEVGEDPTDSMMREIQEETALPVEGLVPFDVEGSLNETGHYWVTIAYKARAVSNAVTISWEHDEYQWVNVEEFLKLESNPKIVRFVKKLRSVDIA